jgi:Transposase
MRKSRFTDEQIVGFLKQAEAGLPVKELCRKGGFSDATDRGIGSVRDSVLSAHEGIRWLHQTRPECHCSGGRPRQHLGHDDQPSNLAAWARLRGVGRNRCAGYCCRWNHHLLRAANRTQGSLHAVRCRRHHRPAVSGRGIGKRHEPRLGVWAQECRPQSAFGRTSAARSNLLHTSPGIAASLAFASSMSAAYALLTCIWEGP